ncbi:hypothetical protein M3212_20925 [Alkalihalobacillus oceani]|nr:hypothetical protein [Halalkalibacter oceani]MCM3763180.1 hypothetical protein [Halalkalibacter oceani]
MSKICYTRSIVCEIKGTAAGLKGVRQANEKADADQAEDREKRKGLDD